MFLKNVSLKLQICVFSISLSIGLLLMILVEIFQYRKVCCFKSNTRILTNKIGHDTNFCHDKTDLKNDNNEMMDVNDDAASNRKYSVASNGSENIQTSLSSKREDEMVNYILVKPRNSEISENYDSMSNQSSNDPLNSRLRSKSLNQHRIDLSKVEAKYLNFTKTKRPSYTNYLQKSKKSFIGYDQDILNDRRASKISNRSFTENSRRVSTNSTYLKRLSVNQSRI